jgi:hypothetical protein
MYSKSVLGWRGLESPLPDSFELSHQEVSLKNAE